MAVIEVSPDTEPDKPKREIISQTTQLPDVGRGPLGIVPPDIREDVIGGLAARSGPERFVASSALPVAGAAAGAKLGIPLAPFTYGLSIPIGAGLGGLAGELVSEDFGFSPEDRVNQVLSLLGPIGGQFLGKTFQLVKSTFGKAFSKSPPVRLALSKARLDELMSGIGNLGGKILDAQKGLLRRSSSALFKTARLAKQPINASNLNRTRSALNLLSEEVKDFRSLPEGRAIIATIRQINQQLFPKSTTTVTSTGIVDKFGKPITKAVTTPPKEITTETLGRLRSLVGAQIGQLEEKAGVKLGASKQFFQGMSGDLDELARQPGLTGRVATIRKAAVERAKLEFAVDDLEAIIQKATLPVKGGGDQLTISASKVLKELDNLTNPKSQFYDKNFTAALKDQLPEIKQFFQEINALRPTGSPGGGGSIVYRAATASLGRTAGAAIGSHVGGTVGAMFGANAPEMITALLLTKNGRKIMIALSQVGSIPPNHLRNAVLGELVAQGASVEPLEQSPIAPLPETLPQVEP